MGARLLAGAAALVSGSVLLTACNAGSVGGSCRVSVSSADLVKQREAAGIADCTTKTLSAGSHGEAADLPDTTLGCLGSKARVSLSDIRGPAIVNFWASNCGPCRKEMPALADFAKKYDGQVALVGVDWLETYPGAALDLAHGSGVTYPLLADPCGDLEQSSMRTPVGMPATYFVKGDGTVSDPVTGGFDSAQQIADAAAAHGITLAAAG